jgi:3-oxoacyl-[acyl-carrier protein] reductase
MKKIKVWIITGALEGLGPAAIKYLLAKKQIVLAILLPGQIPAPLIGHPFEELHILHIDPANESDAQRLMDDTIKSCGTIDILINNSCYELVDMLQQSNSQQDMENTVCEKLNGTLLIVKLILPFMKAGFNGHIINLPPKPCIDNTIGEVFYNDLQLALDNFSDNLQAELSTLDKKLTRIECGDRFIDPLTG